MTNTELVDSAERMCPWCDTPIGADLLCEGCEGCHTHCPYCGTCSYPNRCDHLLLGGDPDFPANGVLFEAESADSNRASNWPHLSEEHDGEFSESILREAFGPLLELVLAGYEDDLCSPPSHFALGNALLDSLAVDICLVDWSCIKPMLSSGGTDYFAAAPEEVLKEVADLKRQLEHGFKRLAAS